MKLVVVGGSAHSTPNLFAHGPLRAMADSLEVVLVGRSSERLDAVARAIKLVTNPEAIHLTCETLAAGCDTPALRGADVVLCQARYGGYEARASDETFPLKYGLCGDEGIGVGGLAAAWRAWPPLRATLEAVRRDCPSARVILMTSPVGVLTRCALAAYPELWLAGICELPWTTLRDACATVGVDGRDATFEYAGVNHLGWFWRVYTSGRDVVAEYGAARAGSHDFPTGELIDRLGAIPLKYLRMHYESHSVLLDQLNLGRPRGQVLSELQQRAYDAYRNGDVRAILELLPSRPTPWYEHAIAPLIAGFAGRPTPIPFFLTVRNARYAAEFGVDDVLEIPHRFADGGLTPIARIGMIPAHLHAALEAFVAYERMASEAVRRRDVASLQSAVRSHPWVSNSDVATLVVSEICR
jgi:6-phospho-beta-glucosidase